MTKKYNKKYKTKKNKKGGVLTPAEAGTCINSHDTMTDPITRKNFGNNQELLTVNPSELSKLSDNTCYRTTTLSNYVNYLLSNGSDPDSADFVTPDGTYIDVNLFDLDYNKEIRIPKRIKNGAFNNVKPDMDYRSPDVKRREQDLMAKLLESKTLYKFVSDLFFSLKEKTLGLKWPEGEKWLLKNMDTFYHEDTETKVKDKNILLKPGYQCDKVDCSAVLHLTKEEFHKFNKDNSISFLQIMGALYKFPTDPNYIKAVIDSDPELQAKFMNSIRLYFKVPPDMTYDEYSKLIDDSFTHWFYPWVYTFLTNIHPNLIHQMKSADDELYLRKVIQKNSSTKDYKLYTNDPSTIKGKKTQFVHYNPTMKLVAGNTYVTPRTNGVWYNTMKTFKKEMIAGPSGSSVFIYQNVFVISKILEETLENKIMLLLAILADYTGFYHSTTEILQVFIEEAGGNDAGLPPYDLSMDDVDYIESLIAMSPIF